MSRLVDIFKKLVMIDSPTGSEDQLADFLVSYFAKRNIQAEKDPHGNVFVRVTGKGEPLFISAHMDTVEPGKGIIPVVSNGIIKSKTDTVLGADNKSTIAVILEVLELLKNKNHRPLEILFTVDEEFTTKGGKLFDYSGLRAKKGIIADIALPIGTIVLAQPTYMGFEITLTGKSGHASVPEKAVNIIPVLSALITNLKTGKLDEKTVFNIGIGNFGSARNAVPGKLTLIGEIRSFDEALLQKHANEFFSKAKTIAKKFGVQIKISSMIENKGYSFEEKDSYVQEIAASLRSQNITPNYVRAWSGSDASTFNTKGLQVVNIGDGTKETHTVNEHVKIEDMEKLADIIERFCTK